MSAPDAGPPRAQWSRASWLRVIRTVVAVVLAWWPVWAFVHVAAVARYFPAAWIAGGYILFLGGPSWLLALVIAAARRAGPGEAPGKWCVFAICCLPLPLILCRAHILVARLV